MIKGGNSNASDEIRHEHAARSWARANLFSSPLDGVLTALLCALFVWVAAQVFEWALLRSVWDAASFDECQEIVGQRHGPDARGACWAVLLDRGEVLLFGFYPPDQTWRPVLAITLMLGSLVLVVSAAASGWRLWFSVVFPFVAYYLIWGGLGLEEVSSFRLGGLLLMLTIATFAAIVAVPFGVVLAIGRRYAILPLRMVCAAIIDFARGVPLIVLLFAALIFWNLAAPPGLHVSIILRVSLCLAIPTASLIAATLVEALKETPPDQREAARALGLSEARIFWLVILPQVMRREAPTIIYALASLFRNTTLVIVVGMLDPIGLMSVIHAEEAWNGAIWELAVITCVLLGGISLAITIYARHVERKLRALGNHRSHATLFAE